MSLVDVEERLAKLEASLRRIDKWKRENPAARHHVPAQPRRGRPPKTLPLPTADRECDECYQTKTYKAFKTIRSKTCTQCLDELETPRSVPSSSPSSSG